MKTINSNSAIVIFFFFLLVFLTTTTTMANENNIQLDDDHFIYKDWVIYKSKAPSIHAMSSIEAEALNNKVITIKPNQIIEFGNIHDNCVLTKKNVSVEDYYLYGFKTDYKKLDLKEKITTLYEYSCEDLENGKLFFDFLKYGNELIYNIEGYFFYLK